MQRVNTSKDIQIHKIRMLFTILFTFLIAFTVLNHTTLTVQADDNAGGQTSSSGNTQNGVSGGASSSKTGYRIYVVDTNGTLVSPVVDIVNAAPSYNTAYQNTRLGNGMSSRITSMPSDMPTPIIYTNQFEGNGVAVRDWMISINDAGVQRGYTLIAEYLGADIYNLFLTDDDYYLVLEALTWHDVFSGFDASDNTGIGFYGTVYNWLDYQSGNGYPDGRFTRKVENKTLAKGFSLVRDRTVPQIIGQTGTSKGSTTLHGNYNILYQCEPSLTV